ncbi:hypothetical protein H0E87_031590, partial [Populus deltoides]
REVQVAPMMIMTDMMLQRRETDDEDDDDEFLDTQDFLSSSSFKSAESEFQKNTT